MYNEPIWLHVAIFHVILGLEALAVKALARRRMAAATQFRQLALLTQAYT